MPDPTPRRFSVVINTYNRADSLELTLRGLERLDVVEVEVVVVNGPSTDRTDEVLEAWSDRVKVGRCTERNLSMSRNIGIALAAGDVIAFIDDDAYPDPGWLAAIDPAFDDPEVAAAGGPALDYTGATFQARYSVADRLGDAWVETGFDVPNPTGLFDAPSSRSFLYPIGTNASFRRADLVAIGGFDEEFEYYLDETDVCARLSARGRVVRHVDEALVFHKFLQSAIRSPNRAIRDRFAVIKNRVYFSLKHGRPTHSFAEIGESLTTFLDLSRRDVLFHLDAGNVDLPVLEKFDRDVHVASDLGFERWLEGPKNRGADWFDERQQPWKPFPLLAAPDRLHIALLSREYPPAGVNGIGRLIHSLAVALSAEGHEVRVFTLGEHHDTVDLEDGVWVHRVVTGDHPVPADLGGLPSYVWNHAASMYEAVCALDARRPIDVIQAPNWDVEGIAAMRDGRIPVAMGVYTPLSAVARLNPEVLHGDITPQLDAERWCYEHASLLVASGPAVVAEVEAGYDITLPRDRLAIVPNGLPDIERPDPAGPSDGIEILYVGRLERRKGVDGLLAALPDVLDRHPDVRCVLVGDDTIVGPEGTTIRAQFEATDVAQRVGDRVVFAGRVDDDERQRLYERCDVFVAPSRFESFGLILLEAMMLEKPVVAGDCEAMRTIVEGGAGLVASADDPRALGAAIEELVGDPARRAELGRAGRARYEERYSAAAMARGILAAYRERLHRDLVPS